MNPYGMGDNQSMKSMQFKNDLEQKLAERRLVDMETNQPHGGQNGMQGMQMPGMGVPNMGMPGMGMQGQPQPQMR